MRILSRVRYYPRLGNNLGVIARRDYLSIGLYSVGVPMNGGLEWYVRPQNDLLLTMVVTVPDKKRLISLVILRDCSQREALSS